MFVLPLMSAYDCDFYLEGAAYCIETMGTVDQERGIFRGDKEVMELGQCVEVIVLFVICCITSV